MKEDAFKELCESIHEAGRFLRGESKPARVFKVDSVFVRQARAKLNLSQSEFAKLVGIPVTTLQNWEQGRTKATGPARALLIIAAKEPQAVFQALHGEARIRSAISKTAAARKHTRKKSEHSRQIIHAQT